MKKMILGLAMAVLGASARAATVVIDWDTVTQNADGSAIADLSGYRVFYATYSLLSMTTGQAMGAGTVVRTIPSIPAPTTTTLTFASLQDATTYFFRVTAFDTSGNQSDFNELPLEVSTCTPPPVPPTAPGNLTAAALSATQIRLDWVDAANETSYRVERSPDNVAFSTVTSGVAANAITYTNNTGLAAATTYYYRVAARNAVGEAMSGTVMAVTQPAPVSAPTQPTNLRRLSSTQSQIVIAWNDNSSNETAFQVQWSLTGTGGWTSFPDLTTNTTTYAHGSLPAGTTYYYRVRAVNGVGNPAYTAPLLAATSAGTVLPGGGFGPPPGLKECYAYPNPARGIPPTLRGFMGGVESMEVTIYDAAGRVVETGRTTTQVNVNGEQAFEYRWLGEKPPGIYYAVMHGKKGDQTVRARAKFAVVR